MGTAAPGPGAPGWRRNLYVLWWTQLLAVAGMSLLLPVLPLIVRSLGVSDLAQVQRWSGTIFAAPFLFAALMSPVWGWLGDRSSRKWMVVRALLGLALAIFLMGFARTPQELLALRALQGLVSGFIPAAIALVSSTAPRAQLGWALGTFISSQAAGVVVGPLVGGLLADWVGFRSLFFVTAATETVAAVTVMLLVREAPRTTVERHGSLVANARYALRGGPVRVALAGLFMTQCAILLVQPFFALFVESLGVGPAKLSSTTGVLFGVTGVATLVAAPRWGRLTDRIGRRRALWIAFAASALAFLLQAVVRDVPELFGLRVLQGLATAGMLPALYATVASYTPEAQRAGVVSYGSSATLLGGLVGPVLGGALAAALGMRAVFVVAGLCCLLCALNARRLPGEGPAGLPRPRRSWELPGQS